MVFKPQTIGIGRQSIRMSVRRFNTPLLIAKPGKLIQSASWMALFQKAAIGLHWKMVTRVRLNH